MFQECSNTASTEAAVDELPCPLDESFTEEYYSEESSLATLKRARKAKPRKLSKTSENRKSSDSVNVSENSVTAAASLESEIEEMQDQGDAHYIPEEQSSENEIITASESENIASQLLGLGEDNEENDGNRESDLSKKKLDEALRADEGNIEKDLNANLNESLNVASEKSIIETNPVNFTVDINLNEQQTIGVTLEPLPSPQTLKSEHSQQDSLSDDNNDTAGQTSKEKDPAAKPEQIKIIEKQSDNGIIQVESGLEYDDPDSTCSEDKDVQRIKKSEQVCEKKSEGNFSNFDAEMVCENITNDERRSTLLSPSSLANEHVSAIETRQNRERNVFYSHRGLEGTSSILCNFPLSIDANEEVSGTSGVALKQRSKNISGQKSENKPQFQNFREHDAEETHESIGEESSLTLTENIDTETETEAELDINVTKKTSSFEEESFDLAFEKLSLAQVKVHAHFEETQNSLEIITPVRQSSQIPETLSPVKGKPEDLFEMNQTRMIDLKSRYADNLMPQVKQEFIEPDTNAAEWETKDFHRTVKLKEKKRSKLKRRIKTDQDVIDLVHGILKKKRRKQRRPYSFEKPVLGGWTITEMPRKIKKEIIEDSHTKIGAGKRNLAEVSANYIEVKPTISKRHLQCTKVAQVSVEPKAENRRVIVDLIESLKDPEEKQQVMENSLNHERDQVPEFSVSSREKKSNNMKTEVSGKEIVRAISESDVVVDVNKIAMSNAAEYIMTLEGSLIDADSSMDEFSESGSGNNFDEVSDEDNFQRYPKNDLQKTTSVAEEEQGFEPQPLDFTDEIIETNHELQVEHRTKELTFSKYVQLNEVLSRKDKGEEREDNGINNKVNQDDNKSCVSALVAEKVVEIDTASKLAADTTRSEQQVRETLLSGIIEIAAGKYKYGTNCDNQTLDSTNHQKLETEDSDLPLNDPGVEKIIDKGPVIHKEKTLVPIDQDNLTLRFESAEVQKNLSVDVHRERAELADKLPKSAGGFQIKEKKGIMKADPVVADASEDAEVVSKLSPLAEAILENSVATVSNRIRKTEGEREPTSEIPVSDNEDTLTNDESNNPTLKSPNKNMKNDEGTRKLGRRFSKQSSVSVDRTKNICEDRVIHDQKTLVSSNQKDLLLHSEITEAQKNQSVCLNVEEKELIDQSSKSTEDNEIILKSGNVGNILEVFPLLDAVVDNVEAVSKAEEEGALISNITLTDALDTPRKDESSNTAFKSPMKNIKNDEGPKKLTRRFSKRVGVNEGRRKSIDDVASIHAQKAQASSNQEGSPLHLEDEENQNNHPGHVNVESREFDDRSSQSAEDVKPKGKKETSKACLVVPTTKENVEMVSNLSPLSEAVTDIISVKDDAETTSERTRKSEEAGECISKITATEIVDKLIKEKSDDTALKSPTKNMKYDGVAKKLARRFSKRGSLNAGRREVFENTIRTRKVDQSKQKILVLEENVKETPIEKSENIVNLAQASLEKNKEKTKLTENEKSPSKRKLQKRSPVKQENEICAVQKPESVAETKTKPDFTGDLDFPPTGNSDGHTRRFSKRGSLNADRKEILENTIRTRKIQQSKQKTLLLEENIKKTPMPGSESIVDSVQTSLENKEEKLRLIKNEESPSKRKAQKGSTFKLSVQKPKSEVETKTEQDFTDELNFSLTVNKNGDTRRFSKRGSFNWDRREILENRIRTRKFEQSKQKILLSEENVKKTPIANSEGILDSVQSSLEKKEEKSRLTENEKSPLKRKSHRKSPVKQKNELCAVQKSESVVETETEQYFTDESNFPPTVNNSEESDKEQHSGTKLEDVSFSEHNFGTKEINSSCDKGKSPVAEEQQQSTHNTVTAEIESKILPSESGKDTSNCKSENILEKPSTRNLARRFSTRFGILNKGNSRNGVQVGKGTIESPVIGEMSPSKRASQSPSKVYPLRSSSDKVTRDKIVVEGKDIRDWRKDKPQAGIRKSLRFSSQSEVEKNKTDFGVAAKLGNEDLEDLPRTADTCDNDIKIIKKKDQLDSLSNIPLNEIEKLMETSQSSCKPKAEFPSTLLECSEITCEEESREYQRQMTGAEMKEYIDSTNDNAEDDDVENTFITSSPTFDDKDTSDEVKKEVQDKLTTNSDLKDKYTAKRPPKRKKKIKLKTRTRKSPRSSSNTSNMDLSEKSDSEVRDENRSLDQDGNEKDSITPTCMDQVSGPTDSSKVSPNENSLVDTALTGDVYQKADNQDKAENQHRVIPLQQTLIHQEDITMEHLAAETLPLPHEIDIFQAKIKEEPIESTVEVKRGYDAPDVEDIHEISPIIASDKESSRTQKPEVLTDTNHIKVKKEQVSADESDILQLTRELEFPRLSTNSRIKNAILDIINGSSEEVRPDEDAMTDVKQEENSSYIFGNKRRASLSSERDVKQNKRTKSSKDSPDKKVGIGRRFKYSSLMSRKSVDNLNQDNDLSGIKVENSSNKPKHSELLTLLNIKSDTPKASVSFTLPTETIASSFEPLQPPSPHVPPQRVIETIDLIENTFTPTVVKPELPGVFTSLDIDFKIEPVRLSRSESVTEILPILNLEPTENNTVNPEPEVSGQDKMSALAKRKKEKCRTRLISKSSDDDEQVNLLVISWPQKITS